MEQAVQPLGLIAGQRVQERTALRAVQTITGAGISPVSRQRSTRGSVHSNGRTFRAPRLPPSFTAAAGFTGSVCGTASLSALRATACTRLIRASLSGLVDTRWPGRVPP